MAVGGVGLVAHPQLGRQHVLHGREDTLGPDAEGQRAVGAPGGETGLLPVGVGPQPQHAGGGEQGDLGAQHPRLARAAVARGHRAVGELQVQAAAQAGAEEGDEPLAVAAVVALDQQVGEVQPGEEVVGVGQPALDVEAQLQVQAHLAAGEEDVDPVVELRGRGGGQPGLHPQQLPAHPDRGPVGRRAGAEGGLDVDAGDLHVDVRVERDARGGQRAAGLEQRRPGEVAVVSRPVTLSVRRSNPEACGGRDGSAVWASAAAIARTARSRWTGPSAASGRVPSTAQHHAR